MKKLKLNKLDYVRLHNAEFGQFIARFFEDLDKSGKTLSHDADLSQLAQDLKNQLPEYEKALEKIKASEESKKIAELDKDRDNALQALKTSIKAYRTSKEEPETKAYNALKIVFDQYKGVEGDSFEKETNRINTLVATLQSPEYMDDITVLAINKFVDRLKKANIDFNDLFSHRSVQNAQKGSYDVKELRKVMIDKYKKLADYVLALAEVKQDPFYRELLEIINNSRKYYADMLAKRKKTPAKKQQ